MAFASFCLNFVTFILDTLIHIRRMIVEKHEIMKRWELHFVVHGCRNSTTQKGRRGDASENWWLMTIYFLICCFLNHFIWNQEIFSIFLSPYPFLLKGYVPQQNMKIAYVHRKFFSLHLKSFMLCLHIWKGFCCTNCWKGNILAESTLPVHCHGNRFVNASLFALKNRENIAIFSQFFLPLFPWEIGTKPEPPTSFSCHWNKNVAAILTL